MENKQDARECKRESVRRLQEMIDAKADARDRIGKRDAMAQGCSLKGDRLPTYLRAIKSRVDSGGRTERGCRR